MTDISRRLRRPLKCLFRGHDWSCNWSRACTGDHYCRRCGWRP